MNECKTWLDTDVSSKEWMERALLHPCHTPWPDWYELFITAGWVKKIVSHNSYLEGQWRLQIFHFLLMNVVGLQLSLSNEGHFSVFDCLMLDTSPLWYAARDIISLNELKSEKQTENLKECKKISLKERKTEFQENQWS